MNLRPLYSLLFFLSVFFSPRSGSGQEQAVDTAHPVSLQSVLVKGRKGKPELIHMTGVSGMLIFSGKKASLVNVDETRSGLFDNNMRQVLAKVPGIQVWESDGSGIQVGIASRGLSPNRSWEFNIRQNGYDIVADPYGYPEAYYAPPLHAVKQIQVVRGHGSLQYGPQFGGLINYIVRDGSELNKSLQGETRQTAGSNGLYNAYQALGGKTGRGHFYTYFNHHRGDGWRQNSRFELNNFAGTITRKLGKRVDLTAEFGHTHQRMQQPGGLTDSAFRMDARQSFRSRNWLDIRWTTAALTAKVELSGRSTLELKLFTLSGTRSSVGFMRGANIPDTAYRNTGQYQPRTVDRDQYDNTGLEARLLTHYSIGKATADLSGGIRLFGGRTRRSRDGAGSNGTSFDLSPIGGVWPREYSYVSSNAALFAENLFRIGKWSLIPGFRIEGLDAQVSGKYGVHSDGSALELPPSDKQRTVWLGGMGAAWNLAVRTTFYANITQAYRPMLFSDLTAPPGGELIDSAMQDAKGFNADIGLRGSAGNWLQYDAGIYWLQYNNRIGTVSQPASEGGTTLLRTNIGNSRSVGVELLADMDLNSLFKLPQQRMKLNSFVSYCLNRSNYVSIRFPGNTGQAIRPAVRAGNRVENAPVHVLRIGLRFLQGPLSASVQHSLTSEVYTDAANTRLPSTNAQTGSLPGYQVTDLHAQWQFGKRWELKGGINNLFDVRYATRRSGGYPGPGILPADGRNLFLSLGATF